MDTTTATAPSITDFILARVGEDEAVANAAAEVTHPRWRVAPDLHHDRAWAVVDVVREDDGGMDLDLCVHIACHDPARVLAQCAAIRAIVAWAQENEAAWRGEWGVASEAPDLLSWPAEPIPRLAAVWADHKDYQQEWGGMSPMPGRRPAVESRQKRSALDAGGDRG